MQDLARQGYKEITLLGQNVNAYGKDLYGLHGEGAFDFGDLIELIDRNSPGIERIRFTADTRRTSPARWWSRSPWPRRCASRVHLPVQSGSDDRAQADEAVATTGSSTCGWCRGCGRLIPDMVITTDIIVGFPGETEEEFQETLSLVEEVQFDAAFMFMYSRRAGTPAPDVEDRLSVPEKKERLQRLMEVQKLRRRPRQERGPGGQGVRHPGGGAR